MSRGVVSVPADFSCLRLQFLLAQWFVLKKKRNVAVVIIVIVQCPIIVQANHLKSLKL